MLGNSILTGPLALLSVALWCGFSDPVCAQAPPSPPKPPAGSSAKKPAAAVKKQTAAAAGSKTQTAARDGAPGRKMTSSPGSTVKAPTPGKSTSGKLAAGKPASGKPTSGKPATSRPPAAAAQGTSKVAKAPKGGAVAKAGEKTVSRGAREEGKAKPRTPGTPVVKGTRREEAKERVAGSREKSATRAQAGARVSEKTPVARQAEDRRERVEREVAARESAVPGRRDGKADGKADGKRTPAPPATVKAKQVADADAGRRSSAKTPSTVNSLRARPGGMEVEASVKREATRPPFGPDDEERGSDSGEDAGWAAVGDAGDAGDAELAGGLGAEGAALVSGAETPMVLVFGMGGGAGAAAWHAAVPEAPARAAGPPRTPAAEPVPTTTSSTEVPPPRTLTVPEPPPQLPPPASEPVAPDPASGEPVKEGGAMATTPPVAEPELPEAPVPAPAETVPPEGVSMADSAPAEPLAAATQPPTAPPAAPTVRPAATTETPTVPSMAAAAAAAADRAVPADLSDLAALAQSLPALPKPEVREAVVAAVSSWNEGPADRARATVKAVAEAARPVVSGGDARVIAASLLRALPDSADGSVKRSRKGEEGGQKRSHEATEGAVAGRDDEAPTMVVAAEPAAADVDGRRPPDVSAPARLPVPAAPDELAPQRADRSGSAFDVPAAAGDLLIAANSQTDFEMEKRRVVFSGNVIMKNERFYLTADTLIAYMKEDQAGLKFAEAQGNVVVRMVENGRETGSSGLSKSAVFHPDTGEIVLRGWPQLRMGNKAHVASAATTEMSLFTDGRMKTSGRNQTMIVP